MYIFFKNLLTAVDSSLFRLIVERPFEFSRGEAPDFVVHKFNHKYISKANTIFNTANEKWTKIRMKLNTYIDKSAIQR